MTKIDKLKERLLSYPVDFTWEELKKLLGSLGYQLDNKGKTSSSRVSFIRDGVIINLHKPHPGSILRQYQLKQVVQHLQQERLI